MLDHACVGACWIDRPVTTMHGFMYGLVSVEATPAERLSAWRSAAKKRWRGAQ